MTSPVNLFEHELNRCLHCVIAATVNCLINSLEMIFGVHLGCHFSKGQSNLRAFKRVVKCDCID